MKKDIYIGQNTFINVIPRPLLGYPGSTGKKGVFQYGKNVWIGACCVIGTNVTLGDNVIISDGSYIEDCVTICSKTIVVYKCLICSNAKIGNNCIIGGFVGENTIIGNNCRIFGEIVHEHLDPSKDWDAPTSMEKGPTIHDNVFMGFGSKITKAIEINEYSYILPNAIISKDVPPFHIVKGVNEMIYFKDWKGDLSKSDFFKRGG